MWVPVVGLPVTFLLLLFPDGHLPSPRWRWFAWILGVSLVVVYLDIVLSPGKFGDEVEAFANFENPLGVECAAPRARGCDRQPGHAPYRGDRFARRPGAAVPPLLRDRAAPASMARDGGDDRGGPLHRRPVYRVRGLLGHERSAGLDDRSPEHRGVLVRPDPHRDRGVGAALPPVRHRCRDQPTRCSWVRSRSSSPSSTSPSSSGSARSWGAGRTRSCRPPRPRSSRSRSSPLGAGAAIRRPARVRRARCAVRGALASSRSGSATCTRTRSCCRGWRARSQEGTGAVRADVWLRIGDELVPEARWPHDAEPLPAMRGGRGRRREVSGVRDAASRSGIRASSSARCRS